LYPEDEESATPWIFLLTPFAFVFGTIWFLSLRPVLELAGWGLHILIDIPTHRDMFAPHFLWPPARVGISGVRREKPSIFDR
jgi:hypothetical protein